MTSYIIKSLWLIYVANTIRKKDNLESSTATMAISIYIYITVDFNQLGQRRCCRPSKENQTPISTTIISLCGQRLHALTFHLYLIQLQSKRCPGKRTSDLYNYFNFGLCIFFLRSKQMWQEMASSFHGWVT